MISLKRLSDFLVILRCVKYSTRSRTNKSRCYVLFWKQEVLTGAQRHLKMCISMSYLARREGSSRATCASVHPSSDWHGIPWILKIFNFCPRLTAYDEGVSTKYPQPALGVESHDGIFRGERDTSAEEVLPRADRLRTHRLLESALDPQLWSFILLSNVWWWTDGGDIMPANFEHSKSNSWDSEVKLLKEIISGVAGTLPLESRDSLFIW